MGIADNAMLPEPLAAVAIVVGLAPGYLLAVLLPVLYIMDSRLVYCLQHGLPFDMDVYDLGEWCCLAELGSLSMDNGNKPVEVPDFTRGKWNKIQGYRHAE